MVRSRELSPWVGPVLIRMACRAGKPRLRRVSGVAFDSEPDELLSDGITVAVSKSLRIEVLESCSSPSRPFSFEKPVTVARRQLVNV